MKTWLVALVSIVFVFPLSAQTTQTTRAVSTAADKNSYLSQIVNLLNAQWPHNRTINIICHGHSVPAGYFKTPEVRMLDAYPNLLHERLCERFGHAVINVIVTAIGGENSQHGAQRFEKDVLAAHPDLVTIDYGLNDRGIGLEAARKAWVSMIQAASAAGAKVILLTPTPDTGARLDDPNDPLNQQAEQIRALAAEYHVGLIDSLSLFEQYQRAGGGNLQDLMAQSNHPNRKGHEIIARELATWFGPDR